MKSAFAIISALLLAGGFEAAQAQRPLFGSLDQSQPESRAEPRLDPAKTIEADGSITLSDGSSYYTFSKGGAFLSGPLREVGRRLEGEWKLTQSATPQEFTVIAKYDWIDGASRGDGYRKIVFRIGTGDKRPFRDQMVPAITEFGAYFLIQELVAIPAPGSLLGRGLEPQDAARPVKPGNQAGSTASPSPAP